MTRLLTLTGAGGCGKTRLALEVARDLVGAYPDGVWLVEPAPLSEDELVVQTVVSALGVREPPNRPLLETLMDTLRTKRVLLVVDNCEHLVEGVARVVDALLDSCPKVRILVTGRERLRSAGEVDRVVPSLTVPFLDEPESRWPSASPPPRQLEAYESVRLFVERDGLSVGFAQEKGGVALPGSEVCRRLEGMPLAIELAAARMGVLSVGQLAKRLEGSLKVLRAGARTAELRHRSLRATLEWSHDLLSEREGALREAVCVCWRMDSRGSGRGVLRGGPTARRGAGRPLRAGAEGVGSSNSW